MCVCVCVCCNKPALASVTHVHIHFPLSLFPIQPSSSRTDICCALQSEKEEKKKTPTKRITKLVRLMHTHTRTRTGCQSIHESIRTLHAVQIWTFSHYIIHCIEVQLAGLNAMHGWERERYDARPYEPFTHNGQARACLVYNCMQSAVFTRIQTHTHTRSLARACCRHTKSFLVYRCLAKC